MSKKLSTAYLQSSSFEGNNVLALRFTNASSREYESKFSRWEWPSSVQNRKCLALSQEGEPP